MHQALETDPSWMRTILLMIAELYCVEKVARERGLAGEPGTLAEYELAQIRRR